MAGRGGSHDHACLGRRAGRTTRPGADRTAGADPRTGRAPGQGARVRGVPHRPPSRPDELPPRRPGTVPGHEVVGRVHEVGADVRGFAPGHRVGVAWLRSTCGRCTWCRRGAENLCPDSTYTGWDADGGYAEYVTVPAAFAYALPDHLAEALDDDAAAPLLCAGIIGYRALRRAQLPPGGRLGIYGFGASAHITAQIALAQGAEVHVLTRDEPARALALRAGGRVGRRRHRRPARRAGRGHPVRAGGRPGAGRPRGPGPRRDTRRGRHPPQRRPGAGLPAAPVPRAHPHQRHRQHASRRRGAARARRTARGATAGAGPTTSRTPPGRSPTSRPGGSPEPP